MAATVSTRAPRQAAKKAATKFEEQLMSSPVQIIERSTLPPAKAKSVTKRARSRPNQKERAASSSKRSTGVLKAASSHSGTRKRALSLDSHVSDDENVFDLTSLSTPTASPVLKPKPAAYSLLLREDSMEADDPYVWVLVDSKGKVFRAEDENDGVERVWWPAQMLPSRCSVKLYGNLSRASNVVAIDTVSNGNVLPLAESDTLRYTRPRYLVSLPDSTASPKKRQRLDRTDFEARWLSAVSEALHEYTENTLPSLGFLHSARSIPKFVPSSQPVRESVSDEESELSEPPPSVRWSPPPVDDSLDIPGEKVLAREYRKHSKEYWPALILSYIEPSRLSEPPLYEVKWVDGNNAKIPRDHFYTVEEDGFGDCVLGKFQSLFDEVVNDTDEPSTRSRRSLSPSPEPLNPPPDKMGFRDLSVREQFVYTKPVLQAILLNQYSPARERSEKYLTGTEKQKKEVVERASARGLMNPREVDEFLGYLQEWCVRDTVARVDPTEEDGDEATNVLEEETMRMVEGVGTPKREASPPEPQVITGSTAAVDVIEGEDPAAQETLCNPPSPTQTTEVDTASSPAPFPPPSSAASFVSSYDTAMDSASIDQSGSGPHFNTNPGSDTSSVLSEPPDVSALVSSTFERPPRQMGCEAYESLPTLGKIDYCLNVLLPELLTQINVWRSGDRTCVTLLSEEEEARLHALGEEEKRKTDWVTDVVRLRRMKERKLQSLEVVVGGTVSRPKKAIRRRS
ncbi:hypothetical protein R3P38DRAFT_2615240 [Favolaschia claudopus]|uniref:Uncharacterized protein n=1 Tax=Favolaschia claudopus TaxID=2862362 RepID=A0AAW0CGP7_9AGAR